MSNQTNNGKCKTDLAHDIARLPDGVAAKGAFEAVFLGNMLAHIDGECINNKKIIIKQQCKTQLPDIHSKNWCKWLTAVDQENQISLTHTIERANVPILYNTPRLCDPGITMSKNWSLRNYIESRLYMFKFVYDFGRGYTQTSNGSSNCRNNNGNNKGSPCYPSTVFDFRPYTFALELPGTTNKGRLIYVTQHITVDDDSGALGFTPHTSLTTYPYKPVKNTETSQVVFKSLVKAVIDGKALGSNQKSVLDSNYNLGNNGRRINNQGKYIDTFIDFLRKYDRIKFAGEDGLLSNSNQVQKVTLTDSVIRTMFYDLIHDEVINKTDNFEKFRDKFIQEFNDPNFGFLTGGGPNKMGRAARIVTYPKLIGKTIAGKSYKAYGSILTPVKANNGSTNFKTQNVKRKKDGKSVTVSIPIPQYPALFKTIGDLSQFMYAAKFNTIVGSGDKMGIATGLYVNALNRKIVKCMIEDAVTGFIIYTGMDPKHVKFVTKSGCGRLANKANTCYGRNGATVTAGQLQSQMINSLNANEKIQVNGIINRQKTYLNRLKTNLRKNKVQQLMQQGASPAASAALRAAGGPTNRDVRAIKITRARNLNAYINKLQRQLGNRGKLNKSVYLSNLNKNNSNVALFNIKARAYANALRARALDARPGRRKRARIG
ncbi:hypothetical protein FK873_gp149 [Micromonas pusilla virus SP1]|uniref:Uncharacterized protein n=1 Tax=Micromonas pusilla virus SP1 TaxID=373996 RepID=G9E6G2_MPSP1|nr:hypothetical protein FK873_gp149 [Micromonas pusilla virus SP1]AET84989.1 hypothetical protein MPXG_00191 [Micromonas pusilla virus SP1]